jgi:hypothetical protein
VSIIFPFWLSSFPFFFLLSFLVSELRPFLAHLPYPPIPLSSSTRCDATNTNGFGADQCDETHPTCNNCKKSKRDCLGYDPVFNRSQPGPGQSTSPLATTHPLIGPGGVVQASPASQPTTPSAASAPINLPSSATAGPRQTATYNAQPPFLSSSSSSSYPAVANHSPTPTPLATPTSTASTTAVGYDPSYHSAASTTPSLKNDPCYQLSPAGPDPSFRMLPSTSMHDNSRMLDSRLISDHNSHLRGGAPSA